MEASLAIHSKAITIAENLFKYCVAPDDGKRIRETGSIAPASTLKHRKAKEAFRWAFQINAYNKRYFTQAAVHKGILMLLEKYDVRVPIVAGVSFDLWCIQQTKIVLHLCQRARKNHSGSFRFLGYRQAKSMDFLETIPLEEKGL